MNNLDSEGVYLIVVDDFSKCSDNDINAIEKEGESVVHDLDKKVKNEIDNEISLKSNTKAIYEDVDRTDINTQVVLKDYSGFLEGFKNTEREIIQNFINIMHDRAQIGQPKLPEKIFVQDGSKYRCIFCKEAKKNAIGAIIHYRSIHGPDHHRCMCCEATFKGLFALRHHENKCSGENSNLLRIARKIFVQVRPDKNFYGALKLPCKVCKKMIARKNMKTHMTSHGEKICIKRFKCRYCPAVFNCAQSCQSHEYAHSGYRPYKCDQCPKAYTSLSALRIHLCQHSSVSYECDTCGISYKRKDRLQEHIKTHQESYLCPECGAVLLTKQSLSIHLSKHAGTQKRHACPDCNKMYNTVGSLNVHMEKKHGKKIITRKMFFNRLANQEILIENVTDSKNEAVIENVTNSKNEIVIKNDLDSLKIEVEEDS